MNNINYKQNLIKLLSQRNSSLIFGLGMLITNVLLGIMVFNNSEKVVLLPTQLKQSVWLQGNSASEGYLEEMALWFAHLMLDKNPKNQRFQHKLLLDYVSPHVHGEVVGRLLSDEKRYIDEGLTTSFYPKEAKTNLNKNEVILMGELVNRVGGKEVAKENKLIVVKFSYLQGRWRLHEFRFKDKDSDD